jgi:hypothetical protein
MNLTQAHLGLLAQLAIKSQVSSGSVPVLCKDLEQAGFVTIVPINISEILIEISQAGRNRLKATTNI